MGKPRHEPAPVRASGLAAELRVTLGKLSRRLRAQAPPGDLTWPQFAVLLHLENHGPATVTALAKAEGVRPQSMGATIAALEAAGLVGGEPHPTDGRQTILSLTAAYRAWIKANRAAKDDWLAHALRAQLSASEQAEVARALELFQRLVES
jgi:DNA-binding MarR family transcriptional regulator